MPKFIDLTKQKFNRLTIKKRIENNKHGQPRWECECICGKILPVLSYNLISGNTKSCGCLQIEIARNTPTIHKMCKTVEYETWCNIIKRCTNKNSPAFKDYGGRDITICPEWRHDFMAFYNHVGKRPSPKHSIDRIKNNVGYLPGNVRWATRYEQNNNKRNNHKITLHGWTMTIAQWSKFIGIDPKIITTRIFRKWPYPKAIFKKINHAK